MDITEPHVTSEEANQPPEPPASTTKSFSSPGKNWKQSSRSPSPSKLIETAVKSANYSGQKPLFIK